MADDLTAARVEDAIADATHPEIDATLVELGMIDDVRVASDEVTVDVAIPMAGIPDQIKELLAHRLADELDAFDVSITVQFVLMDDETRTRFFEMEEQNWSGLDGEDGPDGPAAGDPDAPAGTEDTDAPF
ncbi:iron-sulfur cluster assembly protein [Halococcoides cellulosivorans]|uniref:MIP18 family-like domain-containing protein n=1 Tax=Halococcoides cellulosivorans TaxID=1679096 RepID=A0A2R4X447_9EURY|nr:iron-sulfur cluster assembly protein [Halococcoides cellulosivorans]AWB28574.1 hypothetical protein HARCEL1_00355 [Halococcoides cellulosivorans]